MAADKVLLRTILYLHHLLERTLKHNAPPLTLSQYRLLYMIQEGPARSVELATASGMTKPSIGALVNQLEENGWIRREEVKTDKRAASIEITAAGRKIIHAFEDKMQQALASFLGANTLSRADSNLRWLFDNWREKRGKAHDRWILRKTDKSKRQVHQ